MPHFFVGGIRKRRAIRSVSFTGIKEKTKVTFASEPDSKIAFTLWLVK